MKERIARCAQETCSRFREQASASIEVYDQNLGFVVGCGDRAVQTVALLGDLISRRAKDEFELNSLSAEILDKCEEINLLYNVSETLGAIFDTELICKLVLGKAMRVIGVRKASVMLLDEEARVLRTASAVGLPRGSSATVRLGEGISGRVAQTRKPLLIDSAEDVPRD